MADTTKAYLSKGIAFSIKGSGSTYTEIVGLTECPNMGATFEKVDVTSLKDGTRRYIAGIGDYGSLDFKFLYDNSGATSNYRQLKAIEDGKSHEYKVEFPDGTSFTFSGEIHNTIQSASVNAPLYFVASVALDSDITVTDPVGA